MKNTSKSTEKQKKQQRSKPNNSSLVESIANFNVGQSLLEAHQKRRLVDAIAADGKCIVVVVVTVRDDALRSHWKDKADMDGLFIALGEVCECHGEMGCPTPTDTIKGNFSAHCLLICFFCSLFFSFLFCIFLPLSKFDQAFLLSADFHKRCTQLRWEFANTFF